MNPNDLHPSDKEVQYMTRCVRRTFRASTRRTGDELQKMEPEGVWGKTSVDTPQVRTLPLERIHTIGGHLYEELSSIIRRDWMPYDRSTVHPADDRSNSQLAFLRPTRSMSPNYASRMYTDYRTHVSKEV